MTNEPVGFATLAAAAVPRPARRDFPYRDVAVMLIGRLAVDVGSQRQGCGRDMMSWIRVEARSMIPGCRFLAVHVDSDNRAGIAFYDQEGFVRSPATSPGNLVLYLCDLLVSPAVSSDAAKAAGEEAGLE
jgi:GNAT superfamily N-acetyltransferase